jgi:hypothetical protein
VAALRRTWPMSTNFFLHESSFQQRGETETPLGPGPA